MNTSHPRISTSQRRGLRIGFTLVELLVVIAIIGLLVALLLSAVQYARESARRMQCQSHLRQLGLAAQNFESAKKRFPSGGWGYQWQGFSDIRSSAGQPGSWTFALLPYLEQNALHELGRYGDTDDVRQSSLQKRVTTSVGVYNCPSRRGGEPIPLSPDCDSCARPRGTIAPLIAAVRGDYAINIGDGVPELDWLMHWPLPFPGPANLEEVNELERTRSWPKPPNDWTGISWLRTSISISQVSDGTAHTFLFGEKYVMSRTYRTGEDWGDNEPMYGGFNNDNHRGTHPGWPLLKDEPERLSHGSFGSAHASGVNFVMVDGSVHHVAYGIDSTIFRYLGNRMDGKSVGIE